MNKNLSIKNNEEKINILKKFYSDEMTNILDEKINNYKVTKLCKEKESFVTEFYVEKLDKNKMKKFINTVKENKRIFTIEELEKFQEKYIHSDNDEINKPRLTSKENQLINSTLEEIIRFDKFEEFSLKTLDVIFRMCVKYLKEKYSKKIGLYADLGGEEECGSIKCGLLTVFVSLKVAFKAEIVGKFYSKIYESKLLKINDKINKAKLKL
jgi:hypothetical protein